MNSSTRKRISERAFLMEKNFMSLYKDGYTIPEIAEKFTLHPTTVYGHLEKIAKANGVTRESLLQEIHKTPAYWIRQNRKLQLDLNSLLKSFDTAIATIDETIQEVDDIIDELKLEEEVANS